MIGRLERVRLRDVWKNEAKDFTPWLQKHIDVLNEVIEPNLSNPETERSAGTFSVDLVAEDENGNTAIIECQLEKSDHDHLGKSITYLTAFEAKTAIWIVSQPRAEHVRAVSWLNESSDASFYLIKVEAVRIGNSPPAPLFTVIVGPSEEGRKVGETKKELKERHVIRKKFWTELLARAKPKTRLHANITPGKNGWIGTGAGKGGLSFNYVTRQHDGDVEIYIDRESDAENKKIFDKLLESRKSIERVFGQHLTWQRLEAKRACRIKKTVKEGGYRDDPSKWSETHEAMIDAMIHLEKALKPHIAKLRT